MIIRIGKGMPRSAIDVTLVAGRRPDLLSRTLESFKSNLLDNFEISNVYANIDPIFGGESEHRRCRELIIGFFPNAWISEPDSPSFGKAVKTLWTQLDGGDNLVLHLEDDWILREPILPCQVFPLFFNEAVAVSLFSRHHTLPVHENFYTARIKVKKFGIRMFSETINILGTSPGFVFNKFANVYGTLIDPDQDPEKQVLRKDVNPELYRLMRVHRTRLLFGTRGKELIEDIGREWREARNIVKVSTKTASSWKLGDQ